MTKDYNGDEIKVGDVVWCAGKHTVLSIHGEWLWVMNSTTNNPTTLNASHCRKAPVRHKRWVNIYHNPSAYCPYLTKEAADKKAAPTRIACIEIEFEEGEGL